jgi:hypothetical protein
MNTLASAGGDCRCAEVIRKVRISPEVSEWFESSIASDGSLCAISCRSQCLRGESLPSVFLTTETQRT